MKPSARLITEDDVVAAFARETGERIAVSDHFEGVPRFLPPSVILNADEGLRARFGDFRVIVFGDPASALAVGRFDEETPDDDGIYWQYVVYESASDRPRWAATKLYKNVRLSWWTSERKTNAAWLELDRILTDLAAGKV